MKKSIDEQMWKYLSCTDIEPAGSTYCQKNPGHRNRAIVASNGTLTEKFLILWTTTFVPW